MIKLAFLVKRVESMTHEQFVEYHREHHAPLFASIPEAGRYVRKYTVSHPVPAPHYPGPEFDGLTEIWFDGWDDHNAFFESANYRNLVQPDEPMFIRRGAGTMLVTEERLVM
ncbi:hypothetical protein GCM10010435_49840 [Winogradskya consettensis]|uniref:EthD domain-containing protein n=1 Tax=Winogradskya consettensis TaxID=113560 RepID=A0A919SWQ3_9ACTN|nr:EthD domain-containing protein [Actinoplanes consettensis]GIM80071.1 hypothetical protein Aco04nite_68750 [Actinoplanes consettensis]